MIICLFFFFQAEDGIRDKLVTGVQTCALPIYPKVREGVPEQLARRYRVLPLRITDSFLEVATANPFDLDAEKALAFATAREIRSLLAAPSRIAEKLDEMYRPEKALDKVLQGMEGSADLVLHPETERSEEHTSELQSLAYLVCRLLLEKKKKNKQC